MTTVVTTSQDLTDAVVARVTTRLPGASGVHVHPSERSFAVISFYLDESEHTFRLLRKAGLWYVREWMCDGRRETLKDSSKSSPRFESLIASLLGYDEKQPRVRVVEMRCPEDPRRLFGKLIIQEPLPRASVNNLIEFSCPQCKRGTQKITMHLFSTAGDFVKTEAIEPYIKQEPKEPWFSPSNDNGGHQKGG